ncbi:MULTISPECIES: ATP-grasp domain-containing protein [Prauserella salsuginis group]|uniref:ATP-grasp domain-containing protein n=1 Tax=Prauserella salsuginis TaxID=387889 RepID=A0ABW6G066_9PSEU|nr:MULTISPECIES: ATP-grasp domain-containing protein [Prauserella salsuginis group]MCR3721210.1 Biotin carboxylase [Prauserella flava]MCR3734709.1 Biotin carboxylase [Prauserella salsuginis]
MAHVVFVDSRPYGFRAVLTATRLGHDVTFVASESYASAYQGAEFDTMRQAVDRVVPLTSSGDEHAVHAVHAVLAQIDQKHPVDAVIGMHDEVVQSLAPAARSLDIPFTSPAGVENARNKALARDCLAEAGLRTVEYAVVDAPEGIPAALDKVGLPAVVKPAAGSASIGASIVREHADIAVAQSKISNSVAWMTPAQRAAFGTDLIVETYLEGALMSVEIAAGRGVHVPLAVLERQQYQHDRTMELGSIVPAALSIERDREVREYTAAAARALELDLGLFHMEVIMTDTGPCLIDPNPRIVGGPNPLLIKECWGVDVHEALIAVHLGLPVPEPSIQPMRHGGAHVLAPVRNAVHRVDADLSFLRDNENIRDWVLRSRPGQDVRRAESNLHYLGHVLGVGNSREEVVTTCVSTVRELGDRTDIEMINWPHQAEPVA